MSAIVYSVSVRESYPFGSLHNGQPASVVNQVHRAITEENPKLTAWEMIVYSERDNCYNPRKCPFDYQDLWRTPVVTFIIIENDNPSSNAEQGCLHFT